MGLDGFVPQLPTKASALKNEDQARSGRIARAYYLGLGSKLYDAKSEFDTAMVDLLSSIENNSSDIDERIEGLHQIWRHEGFLRRRVDKFKVNLLLSSVYSPMGMHSWRTTDSIRQLEENWMRVARIVNGHHFSQYRMAKSWIGPDAPAVEEMALEAVLR